MLTENVSIFKLDALRKIWKSDSLEFELFNLKDYYIESLLLKEMLRVKMASLAIIDLRSMEYICTVGDCQPVCGYTNQEIETGGVAFFMSKLIPEDFEGLQKMSAIMTQYVMGLTEPESKEFIALFDFRVKGPNGQTRRVMQEGMIIKRDGYGSILFLLAIIADVSSLKRTTRQHLRMLHGTTNMMYEVNSNSIRKIENLTNREREIACLIGQKFNSEEIASKLFISLHTVNTHRQNMLRKFDSIDTMELISLLTAYRVL